MSDDLPLTATGFRGEFHRLVIHHSCTLLKINVTRDTFSHQDGFLHPVVYFDEKSFQLLAQNREVLGYQSGKIAQQDHEYKLTGTLNLFKLLTPKRGERHVLVANRRTIIAFTHVMHYLVDVMYPEAEYIN